MVSLLDNVQQPHNFNPDPAPFGLLVEDLFLKLEACTSENKAPFATVSGKKTHIIEQFVNTWRIHFGPDIYPAIQLIFPNRDPRKFFIKDVSLARLVTKLLDLQKGSTDQTIIQNWKKAHLQKSRLAGASEQRDLRDFPILVSRIISRRRDKSVRVPSTVSVADVNKVLDELSVHTSAREQIDILRPFVARLTIEEVRFFFSILLKESMLSFFERAFLIAWHPDAYDLYKVCSDLRRVVWLLHDPAHRLAPRDLQIHPMHQFIPQSSKKLDISYESLCRRMAARFEGNDPKLREAYVEMQVEGRFLIEEKLDGDRILMHMQDGRFVWHTRRRRDYTLVYGENVHIGALTKHLSAAFHENVSSVVLDGEMLAWDKDRHVILPFGTLRSAAIQEALKQFDVIDVYEGNNAWPFFIVFDILHLNGQDLTNLPLFYRKKLLNQVVRPVPHRLEVLEWVLASNPSDLKRNMQQIVSEHNEGIMVKSLLSKYRVSSRESTWIKVKPEYLEDFGENLDLVVIGKIGRVKTSYMCGLRDEKEPGAFKSFCSVANGFSQDVYRQIESRLCNFWVDFRHSTPPEDLVQFGTKKPDYWINPANSIVLEIKARSIEVTAETPYAAGSTLHNLWCRSVREDKNYDECISLQEYWELKAHYSQDIHKKQVVNRDRRLDIHNSVYGKYPRVEEHHKCISQLFRGWTCVVLTDARSEDGEVVGMQDIQTKFKEHGGEVRLNPKAESLHGKKLVLLGEVSTPRVESLVAEGFDIVRPEWVWECIQQGRLVQMEPQLMYAVTSPELRESMQARTDKYGDSYTICAKDKSQYLGYLMGLPVEQDLSERSMVACMQATEVPLQRLFSGVTFAVVPPTAHPYQPASTRAYHALMRRIQRFGGQLSDSYLDCGYIVVTQTGPDAEQSARNIRHEVASHFDENARLAYIVREQFLNDSIVQKQIVDVESYVV